MKRVCVVVTARPSYARIKSALAALRARPDVDLQVIAAASAVVTRFGKVAEHIEADGYTLAARVSSVVEDDSLANSALSTGLLLSQLAGAFERLRPDVVVTIADRHETLATAIAASYQHIPLCHIQGGEVTGSIDDKVRNAVTQLADVHCVATEIARRRVARLRANDDLRPADVHVTGCPSIDLAAEALARGPLHLADIIVLQHPVTDQLDQAGPQMEATVRALERLPYKVAYFWPGEDAGGSAMSKVLRAWKLQAIRNQPPGTFLGHLLGAKVLVGNSSAGVREASFLGVPVVNIGTRQQGRERAGNVVDVEHDAEAIRYAVNVQAEGKRPERSTLYGDGKAGERIAAILAGTEMEAVA